MKQKKKKKKKKKKKHLHLTDEIRPHFFCSSEWNTLCIVKRLYWQYIYTHTRAHILSDSFNRTPAVFFTRINTDTTYARRPHICAFCTDLMGYFFLHACIYILHTAPREASLFNISPMHAHASRARRCLHYTALLLLLLLLVYNDMTHVCICSSSNSSSSFWRGFSRFSLRFFAY